jgi:nucleotide-binding universal stress UspA family protein
MLGVSLVARRSGPVRLAQRRMWTALAGAGVVVAGQLVDAFALRPYLPAWWFSLALAAAAASVAALAASARALRAAGQFAAPETRALRPLPGPLQAGAAAAAVAAVCVGSAYAENSWAEGLSRGVLEAIAIGICFLALGRRLGLRA